MPLFTRSQLTSRPSRKDEIDAFLSSEAELDLEDSFASNMSLNSPPRPKINLPSLDDSREYVPMDISPAPQRVIPSSKYQHHDDDDDITARLPPVSKVATSRSRSSIGSTAQRLFGKDVSNGRSTGESLLAAAHKGTEKDKATEKNGKRLQRTALPFEWMQDTPTENNTRNFNMISSAIKVSFMFVWVTLLHTYSRCLCNSSPWI
jgi:M-phase inducer tyrosine phosphatase